MKALWTIFAYAFLLGLALLLALAQCGEAAPPGDEDRASFELRPGDNERR